MEEIAIWIATAIVAAYAYGCGSDFGNRLSGFVIRQARKRNRDR